METKTKIDISRENDDTVDMVTTVTQKLTNQEFYDMYANVKIKETTNEQMIKQNELQILQAKGQNEIIGKQITDMEHMAKDCEARLPSRPIPEKSNPVEKVVEEAEAAVKLADKGVKESEELIKEAEKKVKK